MGGLDVAQGLGILPQARQLGEKLVSLKIDDDRGGLAPMGDHHPLALPDLVEKLQEPVPRLGRG